MNLGEMEDLPEVPIDDNNSDKNGHSIHDEGKEKVLSYKRQHQRCWGQNL